MVSLKSVVSIGSMKKASTSQVNATVRNPAMAGGAPGAGASGGGNGAGGGAGGVKMAVPGMKDKRPTSSGITSRGGAADPRSNPKGKGGKAGKTRDVAEDGYDANAEADGQKDSEVSLAWLYLTADQIDELDACEPEEELAKIAQFLCVLGWKEDLQNSILLSFYHSCYYFAKENKFAPIQISVFFSIMKITLDKTFDKSLSHLHALSEFKKLLFDYMASPSLNQVNQSASNALESASWEIFGPQECKLIVDYAISTIFQHHRLYQYVFTNEQEKQEIELPITLELPPNPPPLSEGITFEAYETEQRARELAERDLLDAESLANAVDILDSLSPEEIKQTALDVIAGLLEGISSEFDKMLLEQRDRFLSQMAKVPTIKTE
ncbi:flagellar C1a complex subunit C1a-32-domain-containing protein [Entophlyctis helioformis]|nr:flagellar C1a complex subunit C1a-32-domain-containing protein [Entophlyctis helioformis]